MIPTTTEYLSDLEKKNEKQQFEVNKVCNFIWEATFFIILSVINLTELWNKAYFYYFKHLLENFPYHVS